MQRPRALEPVAKSSPRKPLSSTLRNLHHHYHHHHPDSGAHSDSELEENVRNKLTLGGCGTLPRKRVTFKVRVIFVFRLGSFNTILTLDIVSIDMVNIKYT